MTTRSELEREFRKELIARAAHRLFSSSSYEAITVEDIARAAEFGKGTIYQYFASKEEILAYVVCRGISRLCRDIEEQCLGQPDIRLALNTLMALQYRFHREHGHLFLSLLRRKLDGSLDPELFNVIRQKLKKKTELTATLLEQGIRAGIFVPVDSYKLARILENVIKGFILEDMEKRFPEADAEQDLEFIRLVLSEGIMLHGGRKTNGEAKEQ